MSERHGNQLTWSQAVSQLAVESQEIQRYSGSVHELHSHPTLVRLRGGRPTGATRSHWESALTALNLAESRLRKWQAAVKESEEIVARHQAPGGAGNDSGLGRLTELLSPGRVRLAREEMRKADRPPPGSTSSPPFSLGYVKSLMRDDLAEVQRLIMDVTRVWDTHLPRLEQITADLYACDQLVTAGAPGGRSGLAALRERVDLARDAVENDPLAPSVGGAPVDSGHLDSLEAELREVRRQLTPRPGSGIDEPTLLRERLDLYRRRARAGGRAGDPRLTALDERARRLLRAVPRDLEAVERAVLAYTHEVWRLEGEEGGRG